MLFPSPIEQSPPYYEIYYSVYLSNNAYEIFYLTIITVMNNIVVNERERWSSMNSDFTIAVHSLSYLAHLPTQSAPSDRIAQSVSVHPVRVRKVLSLLCKQGYINSKEGAKGGFELNCKPEDVTLNELYLLTSEGTLKPKFPNPNKQCLIGANIENAMDGIFDALENQVGNYLLNYTIADILDRVQAEASL
jgi:Rrf2 family protein